MESAEDLWVSVQIALFDAVICHNAGYLARLEVLRDFGLPEGKRTEAGLRALDNSVTLNRSKTNL